MRHRRKVATIRVYREDDGYTVSTHAWGICKGCLGDLMQQQGDRWLMEATADQLRERGGDD